jgi:hypothetical protein
MGRNLVTENLRHIDRVQVCCRVTLLDRYGAWTAITEDICARGCRIFTSRTLRRGTRLTLTLSSDLFIQDLDTIAEVVWSTTDRLGLSFVRPASNGHGLSPGEWLRRVVEVGASGSPSRVVPALYRTPTGLREISSRGLSVLGGAGSAHIKAVFTDATVARVAPLPASEVREAMLDADPIAELHS